MSAFSSRAGCAGATIASGFDLKLCDIAICGHTHRPSSREWHRATGVLVMNPGSSTYPRSGWPQYWTDHLRGGQGRLGAHHSLMRASKRRIASYLLIYVFFSSNISSTTSLV